MLIIQRTCLICSAPTQQKHLCAECQQKIPIIRPRDVQCPTCGRPIACYDCQREEAKARAFIGNRSAVRYTPEMKRWLRLYKFRGEQRLAEPFARMLAPALANLRSTYNLRHPLLTHVPLSPARARERGFNQAEHLAKTLAHHTGISHIPLLIRTKDTQKQSMNARKERLHQLDSVFEHLPVGVSALRSDGIIIVDDVYTTGATLAACAKVVKMEVNIPIFCLTWARS